MFTTWVYILLQQEGKRQEEDYFPLQTEYTSYIELHHTKVDPACYLDEV